MLGKRTTENMKEKKRDTHLVSLIKVYYSGLPLLNNIPQLPVTANISHKEGTTFWSLDTPSCVD